MAIQHAASAVLSFDELAIADVPTVGGKNASLGELLRELKNAGVRVPNGFATTAQAYREFVDANGIEPEMREHIERYRSGDLKLQDAGHALRELVLASRLPDDFADQIRSAYSSLAVHRQNIRHNSQRELAECGPRLGVDVKRRACGVASADIRLSVA